MTTEVHKWIVDHFPGVGVIKRRLVAAWDAAKPIRESYSQHGEDSYLRVLLSDYDLSRAIYVDVGANHPTRISNTYLFYRMGARGVVVEPNRELTKLHRLYRPGDRIVEVGCGQRAGIGVFEVSKAPVMSKFVGEDAATGPLSEQGWRREFLPILPLDAIVSAMAPEWIFLLSVDVEGMDLEVLLGGSDALSRSLVVCVEANGEGEGAPIIRLLESQQFRLKCTMDCNLLFVSENRSFDAYRKSVRDQEPHG